MIIVTGGAGFIGSALVWALNAKGTDDILVVDNLASTEKWKNLVPLSYRAYIQREAFMGRVLEQGLPADTTAIVHLGACSSTTEKDADFLMNNNLAYSQVLCEAALNKGCRYIQASSAATYGDGSLGFSDSITMLPKLRPLNMYGYSKHLFDKWAHRMGFLGQIASLKFFNVYGPNEYHKGTMQSVVCKAVPQILAEGRVRLFASDRPEYEDGGQLRDFVYVKDCVNLILWLLETPSASGLMNVGTGKARTFKDLALATFAALGRTPNIEYIPMPESLLGKYQYYTQADMGWLKTARCPLKFTELEDGVKDYVQNYLDTPYPYLSI